MDIKTGISLVAICIALALPASLCAVEITGKVRDAGGDTAWAVTDGDVVPAVGDDVEIFFKLAADDVEISVGAGRVLKVERDSIQLKIENVTGEIAKDQLVRINSKNPQTRASITAPPSSLSSPPEQSGKDASLSSPLAAVKKGASEAARYSAEGLAKFEAKDFKGAIAAYTKSIELDPTETKPYYNLGVIYNLLKQPKQALIQVNEVIKLNPKDSGAYSFRGDCYANLHQLKRAIAAYDEAIRLDPKNQQAYYNRGTVYVELNQAKAAIEDFSQAIALNPTSFKSYANRAACYKAIGKTELAKRDFTRFRELQAGASSSSSAKPAPVPPERKN